MIQFLLGVIAGATVTIFVIARMGADGDEDEVTEETEETEEDDDDHETD